MLICLLQGLVLNDFAYFLGNRAPINKHKMQHSRNCRKEIELLLQLQRVIFCIINGRLYFFFSSFSILKKKKVGNTRDAKAELPTEIIIVVIFIY